MPQSRVEMTREKRRLAVLLAFAGGFVDATGSSGR
jgi:uncharacterized membrane protein YoaK (UPF0700 family)